MEVIDSAKAKDALTVIGGVFFAELGVMLMQHLLSSFMVASFGDHIWAAWSVMWSLVTGALLYGVWALSRAMKQSELLMGIIGALGLELLIDLFWVYQSLQQGGRLHLPEWFGFIPLVVGLGVNFALLYVIGKLGKTTAFVAAIGAFVAVRSLVGLGQLLAREAVLQHTWIFTVRMGLSVIVAAAMGALALHARGALTAAVPDGLGQVAPQVAPEPGGGRLIATGLVLLALGIGGTVLSYGVAASGSGGGRYIIATGAIATGLVQLIRGLGKLGR